MEGAEDGQADRRAVGHHDGNLVENGRRGKGARQDLSRHHPGKGDDAHAYHGIQRREYGRLQCLVHEGQQDALRARAEVEEGFHSLPSGGEALPEGLYPQVHAGHGVPEDHAAQGDHVLGIEKALVHHGGDIIYQHRKTRKGQGKSNGELEPPVEVPVF